MKAEAKSKMKTMAPLTPPAPSVQRGCNSYFADHKRKTYQKTATLGARDFSGAVSGFCQVFITAGDVQSDWRKCNPIKRSTGSVKSTAPCHARDFSRGFGLRRKMMCRPSADTENSRRTREKPLLPRVKNRQLRQNATQAIFSSGRSVGLNLGLKRWKTEKVSGHPSWGP